MSKNILLKRIAIVSTLTGVLVALPGHAALYDLNFSGRLGNYVTARELGFETYGPNNVVSGSMRIDTSKMGPDLRPNSSPVDWRAGSGNWISTSFDRTIPYSYENPSAPGTHYDSMYMSTWNGNYDRVTFADHFTDDEDGYCAGVARPSDYCWHIKINADLSKGSFDFEKALKIDESNLLRADMVIRLVNYDPQYGFVSGNTYRAFNLTSLTLTPVAPVPLPAAAWMFLMALGSFAGMRFKRQVSRSPNVND